ncbi:hypothetical protein IJG20_03275 [Candidatus Saccharibacteria bacterium]|nr:hypothetical protein [Candidatus Saccharibacteria bacterium]
MNKETIYIEPSDDITTILSKIKSSEKKIIALVPPKKPSVLLSSVNIKLIARAARAEKKAVVLVTTDDSLTKLAMAAKLPVAPSLKSRPVLPTEDSEPAEPEPEEDLSPKTSPDDFIDEPEPSKLASDDSESEEFEDEDPEEGETEEEEPEEPLPKKSSTPRKSEPEDAEDDSEETDDEDDEDEKEKKSKTASKKAKKSSKKSKTAFGAWIIAHKPWAIFGAVLIVGLAGFLIWAFTFAPRVEVSIKVRTTTGNFAENITLTKLAADEKAKEGILYVHQEQKTDEQSIKFTATGQKDLGESASGSLVVYYQSPNAYDFTIGNGSTFTINGLQYVATSSATLAWDGDKITSCDNKDDYSASKGCQMSATVSVKASAPGDKYNISDRQTGWKSSEYPALSVYNSSDMTGGTSKIVTIVQQSDVDLALDKLKSENQDAGKNSLMKDLSESVLPIDASFKVETTDPVVSPKVGEEVPEGTTPSVSSKTTYSILTVERAKVEEFIKEKVDLEEGRELYSYGDPFIEYFSQTDENTYSAKLKTTYKYGPALNESEILDKIHGKKIGRVEPDLKSDYPGIASVSTERSFFWVNTIPKNPNKVTLKLEVEE